MSVIPQKKSSDGDSKFGTRGVVCTVCTRCALFVEHQTIDPSLSGGMGAVWQFEWLYPMGL